MSALLLNDSPPAALLQIGSWSARAFFDAASDAALLDEIFKSSIRDLSGARKPVAAELHWLHSRERGSGAQPVPPDGLVLTQAGPATWRIESEALSLRAELGIPLPQIFVFSQPHTLERLAWRVHVSVVFHKLLLLLGRAYFHAGAVRVHDSASAFIAEKGSGKSSICMRLGRAGATILSDDHIVIRQRHNSFQVSGCEQVARVTAVTEATLFPTLLRVEARDFAGVMKKEFRVSEVFDALPYQDVPLERLFFPHVGTRWQLTPLSGRATLARLLETTRSSHRFTGAPDYARHLSYFSDLAQAVQAFDLELSPDLTELDRLVEFLGA